MEKSRIILIIAALVVLVGVVVYMGNINSGAVMAPAGGVNQTYVFKTATSSRLGDYLASGSGMSLYVYAKDMSGLSTCVDQCAVKWPPYLLPDVASLSVDPSVKGSISTLKRADGATQLTYNGSPLYFWSGDKNPGDTLGQNINGVWSVIKP